MWIDKTGNVWYKGNLHLHTTASDGVLSEAEVIKKYKATGYDFIAVTDHWKHHETTQNTDLLILSGCEYDFHKTVREGIFHILSLGADHAPTVTRKSTANDCIRAIHEAGGLACLAHPAWSLNTTEQIKSLSGIDFTEIFNSISDFPFNARPDSSLLVDMLAGEGIYLPLAASDDAHFYTESDSCRSFVMVQADRLDRESILGALRKGQFFSSQGPMLQTAYDGEAITVTTDPVERIVYYSDAVWSPHRCDTGKNLTQGVYKPAPHETFLRVEVCDTIGRRAWSQIIPLTKAI